MISSSLQSLGTFYSLQSIVWPSLLCLGLGEMPKELSREEDAVEPHMH